MAATTDKEDSMSPHIHFVTGKLAAEPLSRLLNQLAPTAGFEFTTQVLPITVAALMTPKWIAKRIHVPPSTDRVIVPGYCRGDLSPLREQLAVSVERGPRDLHGLPEYFGRPPLRHEFGDHDISILAEINHAPQLSMAEIARVAQRLAADGADVIDIGCQPGEYWADVGPCVVMLRELGLRVSIDSMNTREIQDACQAGAELVLSVNRHNRQAAPDWGCEVVVIPDDHLSLNGMDETMEFLQQHGVPYRIDPIISPIGCGFAASLNRYTQVRQAYPECEMMMGIGNITELTESDSAGINLLLMAFCQELQIRSVLTTQVIPWASSSVRECDRARRLVHYAVTHGVIPKHVDDSLVMLRDPQQYEQGVDRLKSLAREIRDHNIRLFAESDRIHLVSHEHYDRDRDPFQLFERLMHHRSKPMDPSHAFYLGYEMAKASIALTLGKQYTQDEALRWGLLTEPESTHRTTPPVSKPEKMP